VLQQQPIGRTPARSARGAESAAILRAAVAAAVCFGPSFLSATERIWSDFVIATSSKKQLNFSLEVVNFHRIPSCMAGVGHIVVRTEQTVPEQERNFPSDSCRKLNCTPGHRLSVQKQYHSCLDLLFLYSSPIP